MTLSFNYYRFVIFLLFIGSFSLISAQQIEEVRVFPVDQPKTNPLALKVQETFSSAVSIKKPDLLSIANVNPEALKLFGVRQANFFNLDPLQLYSITEEKPEAISLSFDLNKFGNIQLDLVKAKVLDEGFYVTTSDGQHPDVSIGTFYQGIVSNHNGSSIVALTVFNDKVLGMISLDDTNINFESIPNEPLSLIVYNEKDIIIQSELSCMSDQLEAVVKQANPNVAEMAAGDCIRVYLECDKALHDNKGGLQPTVDWITAVFNNVKTLYNNESINTTISEIFVWTTPDSYSKTDSYTALTQFKGLRGTFNGDLAHLCALGGNNIGGIAWIDVLCSTYKYAYSNISASYSNVPTYSWTVEVMTHEMGHNIGSNHTQWCGWTGGALDNCYTTEGGCPKGPAPTNGGTIMSYCHLTSYGINFNNGFGTQPGNKIRNEVIAANCLGQSCSGSSCGVPTGLSISNITNTSATASWNSVSGANSYDFEYKLSTSGTWTVVNVTVTNYSMTGLTAGLTYNTRVKAKCTDGNSNYTSTVNFTTTGGSCNTPTGFNVSNITTNSATCSWNAVTGAVSYNFQYKLSTSQTWSTYNTTSTGVNLTGMTPGTSYDVRVQTVCSSGNSAYTSVITFTTLTSAYCASKGNNANYEWIARVKIGSIDRVSGKDGGYYDATNLVTDVNKGSTYTLSHQVGTAAGSNKWYRRVWIDWNRNNSFNDAGEQVVSFSSNSTALQNNNITVPAGASTGTTRMRVSIRYGAYSTSCQTFPYGEVEDYTINIKAAGSLQNGETSENLNDFFVQPNPFNELLNLQVASEKSETISISVFNLLGQLEFNSNIQISKGLNSLELNLSNMTPGQYLVRIDADNRNMQKMIIKK
ncbi:MAG: fibronectin type III domain-containing protein [Saprospiraceae bacterium]|nr:fibronectin type III domain-containing protein [Saprospiraceae bacterium]